MATLLVKISEQRDADLVLQFGDGGSCRVHSQILSVASPVISDALSLEGTSTPKTLQVDGTQAVWASFLPYLYPVAKPALTIDAAFSMLPIIHKYNVMYVLEKCLKFLSTHLPQQFSAAPSSPTYIFRWLSVADDLQLDDLRELCMRKIRGMAHQKQLQEAMLSNVPANLRAAKGDAPKPDPPSRRLSGRGALSTSSPQSQGRWFPTDRPLLLDSVKRLSKGTLEEVLASLVAATSGEYVSSEPVAPAAAEPARRTSALPFARLLDDEFDEVE